MATTEQILELRRLIDEPSAATYGDTELASWIDQNGVRVAASVVWQQKAASYSGLIDVQEGNSNRKLSQLQSQALRMAASFSTEEGGSAGGSSSFRPARTRKIERQ